MEKYIITYLIPLAGVIIGGIIGLIPTIITSLNDFKKWKKDRKIQILQQKRIKMEKLFDESYPKIAEGIDMTPKSQDNYATELS